MAIDYERLGNDPVAREQLKYFTQPTQTSTQEALGGMSMSDVLNLIKSLPQQATGAIRSSADRAIEALKAQFQPQLAEQMRGLAAGQAAKGIYRSPVSAYGESQLRGGALNNLTSSIANILSQAGQQEAQVLGQAPAQQVGAIGELGRLGLQGQQLGLQERGALADLINRRVEANRGEQMKRLGLLGQQQGQALEREIAGAEGRSRLEAEGGFLDKFVKLGKGIGGMSGGLGSAGEGIGRGKAAYQDINKEG